MIVFIKQKFYHFQQIMLTFSGTDTLYRYNINILHDTIYDVCEKDEEI